MATTDTPDTRALADSAARFLAAAHALTDGDLGEPSALPGWSRAHVLAHVARSADSRTGLLQAARAGHVGRQYPSAEARAEGIAHGARQPPAVIRSELDRALRDCLAAIREHPGGRWDEPAIWLGAGPGTVRTVIPSLRRELEYHHVDLAVGYQPEDWPADFVAIELETVTSLMDRRAGAPPMTLVGPGALRIGTSPPVEVTGPGAALLAWLSGRGDGSGLTPAGPTLPDLPPLG